MSRFNDVFDSRLGTLLESWFGDPATLTPYGGGEAVSCQAAVAHDVVLEPSQFDATVPVLGTTITVQKSEVGVPGRGDVFVVTGHGTYTVETTVSDNGVWVVLSVVEAP